MHLDLRIENMSCSHCVAAVRGALTRLEGVQVSDVAIGSARLEYDPSRVTPTDIVEAVNDEGYPATAVG
jgi:copper chaperone